MAEDNAAVESLLLNLSNILVGLKDCKDLSTVSKLDAQKDKKLLKKLKSAVFKIYSKTEKLKNNFSQVLQTLEGSNNLDSSLIDDISNSSFSNNDNILNSTSNKSTDIEHFKGFSTVEQDVEKDTGNLVDSNRGLSKNIDQSNLDKIKDVNNTENDDSTNVVGDTVKESVGLDIENNIDDCLLTLETNDKEAANNVQDRTNSDNDLNKNNEECSKNKENSNSSQNSKDTEKNMLVKAKEQDIAEKSRNPEKDPINDVSISDSGCENNSKEEVTKRAKKDREGKKNVDNAGNGDSSDTDPEIQETHGPQSNNDKNQKESSKVNKKDKNKEKGKDRDLRRSKRANCHKSSEKTDSSSEDKDKSDTNEDTGKEKNKDSKLKKNSETVNTENTPQILVNHSTSDISIVDVSDTSILNISKDGNGKEGNNEINNTKIEGPDSLPVLKLVDINKLMAPGVKPLDVLSPSVKTRKSVTFDSSVIILTSSDDEENPPKIRQEPLKSDEDDCTRQNSDSDPENPKRRSGRNKEKRLKQTRKMRTIEVSDDSSDDSDFELNKKPSRTEKNKSKVKLKFAKLKDERARRSDIFKKRSDEEKRKSKEEKKSKKHKHRNSSESSNESDTEINWENVDPNDPKFCYKVLINLPKFNTEDLPNLYEKKKEVFQVRRLEMKHAKKSKLSKTAKDDSDQPKIKKLKISLKNYQNKVLNSSDSEHSSTEDVEEKHKKINKKTKQKAKPKSKKSGKEIEKSDSEEDSSKEKCESKDKKENVNKKDLKSSRTNSKNSKQNKRNGKKTDSGSDESDAESAEKDTQDQLTKTDHEKLVNGDAQSDSDSEENTETADQKNNEDSISKEGENSDGSDKEDNDAKSENETNNGNKKRKKKNDSDSNSESDKEDTSKKKKDMDSVEILSSGESEDEILVTKKKKKDVGRKVKKKKVLISDSDDSEADKKKNASDDSDSSAEKNSDKSESDKSGGSGSESDEKDDNQSKKSRKRIKRTNSSSDDDDKSTRKSIRRLIDKDSLSDTTKKAEAEEKERKARISEKQKKYNQIFELKSDVVSEKIILDFDEKKKKELLTVNKKLVKNLKPHQVDGVKFMWDACFESIERVQKTKGSGCILAHCMGLGKTLQIITLSHTLLTNSKKTKVEKILVVTPVNTILNWKSEFHKWLPKDTEFETYDLVSCKTSSLNYERSSIVKEWHESGGVLIIGYNMFRTLSNPDSKAIPKKLRKSFQEGLVDPGPDLVVCDEGHLLKNEKTNLSIAMNRIKTLRRIVLTGTPLQNNLKEYWCMVQFIKPNLLGTYKEYLNRFVNPIINGQYTDSTLHDIQLMRKRSHVLHKLLDGVVQRQDYCVLAPYLPPKHEYVLFINLTDVQKKLYRHYMDNLARRGSDGSNRTSFLFVDFQELQRICTHPRVLLDKSKDEKTKFVDDEEDSEGSLKDFIDDDSGSGGSSTEEDSSGGSNSDSSGSYKKNKKKKKKKGKKEKKAVPTRLTRAQRAAKREIGAESDSDIEISAPQQWWQQFIDGDELENINNSGKMQLLFQILKECDEIGDKILVFSQSLYTLNCIEYFLQTVDEASQAGETSKLGGYTGSWALGLDYFRLDGSSSCDNRAAWCDSFNNPGNPRARLFLISTRAGGLGINLVAANRVIIFDVSWNPSHDIQSIYRVYRFGQTKPCYVYRFVSYGTMEMKIYERQVTKQAISKRVIDEQQIDRHYSQNDIQELYKMDLDDQERPIPLVPKDVLLGEMLQKYDKTIFKYHEHQSLLENKAEECLNEEERKAAWEEFENEKVLRQNTTTAFSFLNAGLNNMPMPGQMNASPALIQGALFNIVKKDNPTWADTQIRGILPALVQQLQVQMSENDFTMYARVQQEIRQIQVIYQQQEAERMQRALYQRQIAMMQQQAMQNKLLGNMAVNPAILSRLFQQPVAQNFLGQPTTSKQAAPSGQRKRGRPSTISSEVIDLND